MFSDVFSIKGEIKKMKLFKIKTTFFYITTLPRILFFYFIIIDSINGYFQEFVGVHTPIGIIARGIILLITFPCVIKTWKLGLNRLFILAIALYILALPIWVMTNQEIILSKELGNLFRIIYFFSVLFYFCQYKNLFSIEVLIKYVVLSAFIISCVNLLCFVLDIGIKSYGENFGFGTKAFYSDGNSLGLYMILSTCLSVWYAFYRKKCVYVLITIVISIGSMLIGSRASIVGVLASWGGLLLYFLLFNDRIVHNSKITKVLILLVGGGGIIYILYSIFQFIASFDAYTMDRFRLSSALSPRESLLTISEQIIHEYDFVEVLFGKSFSGGLSAVGKLYSSSLELKSVEADFNDTILSYGWFFGCVMLLLQLLIFSKLVCSYFKDSTSISFVLLLVGILWLGASYMAGHGFNNTMLAPLLSVFYILSDRIVNNYYDFNQYKQ